MQTRYKVVIIVRASNKDTDTGELRERRHGQREPSEEFYQELKQRNVAVRVGMEASGHARWFERLLTELNLELWIGDAAEIRSKRVRKQKTDRQDAQLLLQLMLENRFPRIWVPDAANRDMRQLLWHRHRLVQMRTRVLNPLHVVALNEGLRRKKALWRAAGRKELESIARARWATRRQLGAKHVSSGQRTRLGDAAEVGMLLLGEQDFAASGHDSFHANSLVMVTLRQSTSPAPS